MTFKHAPGCGCCDSCTGCSSPPATLDLVIPTVNELDICSCSSFAGTFTLSLDYDFGLGVGFDAHGIATIGVCYWGGRFSVSGCVTGDLDISVTIGNSGSSVEIKTLSPDSLAAGWTTIPGLSKNLTKDVSTYLDDQDCTANGTLTTDSAVTIAGLPPDCQLPSGSVFELNP